MEALRRVRLGSAAVRSGPTALAARREGYAQGLRPFRCGEEGGVRLGCAAQAQGLRPFAMRLSPHIPPEKYRPENPQAASRPVFFGMTARLVEKLKNPLTTGGRSDNV